MDRSSVAIVIPAFNEEDSIFQVVQEVIQYGIAIVVDDSSTDRTAEIASSAGALVVSHTRNQGYDAALNSGFAKADYLKCAIVITFDADGQHDASSIPVFLKHLENGYDLALGVRGKFPRKAESLFSLYSKLLFGVADPLCGMKGYNMRLYSSQGYFDSYQSIGTQLLFWGIKNKASFTQIQVPLRERKNASRFGSSLRTELKILRSMLKSIRYAGI